MHEGAPTDPPDTPVTRHATANLWLLTLGTGLVAVLLVRMRHRVDPDLWLHLRIGQDLRGGERFGRLPDPLVVLADRAYLPTQWLSEVVMSAVHSVTGVAGIHALRALAIGALIALVQLTAATYTTAVRAAGVALPTVAATAAQWGERPQLAGLVLLAATTWLWSRARRDASVPWAVVPLTWVWAMVHGSWVLGLLTGALFITGMALEKPRRARLWWRLVLVEAASVAVVALTPLGPRLLLEPFSVGAAARGRVNEWAAPSWGNPLFLLVVLMGLTVLLRSARRLRSRAPELLLAASGVLLAATAVRTIAFGALLVAPALAAVFAPRPDRAPSGRTRLSPWPLVATTALLVLAPGMVLAAPSSGPLGTGVDTTLARLPARSVVAVDPASTGWVLWRHQDLRLLRDLRAEVYSPAVASAYESFLDAEPGWDRYADDHGVDAVVVETGTPLDVALGAAPGWREVARNDDHAVWQRTE